MPEVGSQAGVQGDDGIPGHCFTQLSINPLRLERQVRQPALGFQAVMAAGGPFVDFGNPAGIGPGFPFPQLLPQILQHGPGVPLNPYRHRVVAPDFLGVNFNLNNPGLGRDKAVIVKGGGLTQAGAGGQNHIGLADGFDAFLGSQPPQVAQKKGMIAGYGIGPPVGSNDCRPQQVGQSGYFLSGGAPLDPAAGHDNRPFRRQQDPGRLVP